nr:MULTISPECIES: GTP-binding protein [unclassified Coleofasciculus]
MVEPKSNDVCQVRCFNVELVAQVNEALPGDDLLEDAQILFGALADRPLAMKKFQQFLDYRLPDNVFRAKGVLWFAESSKRHLFQLSGKRFTIDDSEWTKTPLS